MTYLEAVLQKNPELTEEMLYCRQCPWKFFDSIKHNCFYVIGSKGKYEINCINCWNRNIPPEINIENCKFVIDA